jgi:hypothetical protein
MPAVPTIPPINGANAESTTNFISWRFFSKARSLLCWSAWHSSDRARDSEAIGYMVGGSSLRFGPV